MVTRKHPTAGRELLRFCRSHKLHVVNLLPLTTGQFTRVEMKKEQKKIEKSTVDYVLVSDALLSDVVSLHIDEDHQYSSDHRPLILTLKKRAEPVKTKPKIHYAWRSIKPESEAHVTAALERSMAGLLQSTVSMDQVLADFDSVSDEHASRLLRAWYLELYQTAYTYIGRKLIHNDGSSRSWY
jgi:hypothetical protein